MSTPPTQSFENPPIRTTPLNALRAVVEFFLPPICHICLERLGRQDEIICDACRSELRPPPEPSCPWCGAGAAKIEGERCRQCPRPRHFDAARGATAFSDTSRTLIHEMKFVGHVELAPVMARWCYKTVEDQWAFESPNLIAPIPLHESRRRMRGFNQAEEIGVELARLSGLALAPEILERVRPTRTQSRLGRGERKENVKGAFLCPAPREVRGKTVLLLDDVMTSGATANECARVLKEAGAARVLVLLFARASG